MKSLPVVNDAELSEIIIQWEYEKGEVRESEYAPVRIHSFYANPSEICSRYHPIRHLVSQCAPALYGESYNSRELEVMTDSAIVAIQSKELGGIAESPYSTTFIEYVLWLGKRSQFVPTIWARDLLEGLKEIWEEYNHLKDPAESTTQNVLTLRQGGAKCSSKSSQATKRGRSLQWDERTTNRVIAIWGSGWRSVEQFVNENRSDLPKAVNEYTLGPEVAVRRILDAARKRRKNSPQC